MEPSGGDLRVWRPSGADGLELIQATGLTSPFTRHFAEQYLIVTVQAGAGTIHYRGARHDAAPDALCIIEPGEAWACGSQELSFRHILLAPARLQEVAAEVGGRGAPHFGRHRLADPTLSATLTALHARLERPTSRLEQESQLADALSALVCRHGESPAALPALGWERQPVKRVKEYLEEHYAEDVPLEDLARVAGLSAFHLSRVFHEAVGLPPHVYQTEVRIGRAKALLARGLPVGDVAAETGFFDQAHFTRRFKRQVGVTPGAYRRNRPQDS